MTDWTDTSVGNPSEGVEVDVVTPGGDTRRLVYASNLWWLPDRSMYVYFTPTHWRLP